MVTRLFLASIVAVAAFAATAPAYAGGPDDTGGGCNGTSLNGLEAQGIDPNGIDPNGIDPNGTQLVGASTVSLDSEDPHVSAQPQPLFSIDGAIVPQ